MAYEIALFRNVKWEYEFVSECSRYKGDIENLMISEPIEVEFSLKPEIDEGAILDIKIAIAEKDVNEAQAKLEAVKNERQ